MKAGLGMLVSVRQKQPRARWCMKASLGSLSIVFGLAGCSPDPWVAYPSSKAPDQQCRTGGEAGYDVYLWYCVGGHRIAVFQYCTGMTGCRDPEKQVSACGAKTSIERELARELSACKLPPTTRRWR